MPQVMCKRWEKVAKWVTLDCGVRIRTCPKWYEPNEKKLQNQWHLNQFLEKRGKISYKWRILKISLYESLIFGMELMYGFPTSLVFLFSFCINRSWKIKLNAMKQNYK